MRRPGRVLVAHHNPSVRQSLEMVLSLAASVQLVDTGADALQRAAATRFDVILADPRMPDLAAAELTRRLLAIDRAHVFIWVTGYPTRASFDDALRLRVFDYVTLPFDVATLLDSINGVHLRRRNGGDAAQGQFGPHTTALLRRRAALEEANPLRRWRRRTATETTNAARLLGVDLDTYLAWESGIVEPGALDEIADHIGEPELRRLWQRWLAEHCSGLSPVLQPSRL